MESQNDSNEQSHYYQVLIMSKVLLTQRKGEWNVQEGMSPRQNKNYRLLDVIDL